MGGLAHGPQTVFKEKIDQDLCKTPQKPIPPIRKVVLFPCRYADGLRRSGGKNKKAVANEMFCNVEKRVRERIRTGSAEPRLRMHAVAETLPSLTGRNAGPLPDALCPNRCMCRWNRQSGRRGLSDQGSPIRDAGHWRTMRSRGSAFPGNRCGLRTAGSATCGTGGIRQAHEVHSCPMQRS